MDTFIKILSLLCLLGALNWGLIGFFGFDLVAALFGPLSVLSRLIYAIIGASAVILIILAIKNYRQQLI